MRTALCRSWSLDAIVTLGIAVTLVILQQGCTEDKTVDPRPSDDRLGGMCYGPHHDNENPDFNVQPTVCEISEDMDLIKDLTRAVRTYGVSDNLEQIPKECDDRGIDCYPGAWIGKYPCENERQIAGLIEVADLGLECVKALIVGNEVILRNDIPEDALIEYIRDVKDATGLPVGSAEVWSVWLEHPQLADAVDVLFVHVYGYWDGIAVEDAAAYAMEKYTKVKDSYPGKTIVIGETGWPSQGEARGNAIPSEENQRRYFEEFTSIADSSDVEYFYFVIFDEKWKSLAGEGDVGAHWGLYYSNGSPKSHMVDLLPASAQDGITRPPRVVRAIERVMPLYVYADGCDPRNGFTPSGWMGELEQFSGDDTTSGDPREILDELHGENPYSGETCTRISYTPSPGRWGGIYWQFPVNNWGEYPGYDLSANTDGEVEVRLVFYARGDTGEEKAEFKTGGIDAPGLYYEDSYGPVSTGVVSLTTDWERYTLNLTKSDLSSVIGGFLWVTNHEQNPQGATIYLDEILFESVK